jgi:hypothetical protein
MILIGPASQNHRILIVIIWVMMMMLIIGGSSSYHGVIGGCAEVVARSVD